MTPAEADCCELLRRWFAGSARWASQIECDLLRLEAWNRLMDSLDDRRHPGRPAKEHARRRLLEERLEELGL